MSALILIALVLIGTWHTTGWLHERRWGLVLMAGWMTFAAITTDGIFFHLLFAAAAVWWANEARRFPR